MSEDPICLVMEAICIIDSLVIDNDETDRKLKDAINLLQRYLMKT